MLKNKRIGKGLLLLLLATCLYGGSSCGAGVNESQPKQARTTLYAGEGPTEATNLSAAPSEAAPEPSIPERTIPEKTGQRSPAVGEAPVLGLGAGQRADQQLPVDRQVARLRSRLRFNTPRQMQMGQATRIALALARTGTAQEKTPEEVERSVTKEGGKEGKVIGAEDVAAAERMRARLTGKYFEIEALDPETQPLTSGELTTWKWNVTPTKWGKRTLHLSVEAVYVVQHKDTPKTVDSYDRPIAVDVTMKQRLVAYTSSIPESIRTPVILAILGAIGTALLGWWKGWWSRIWAGTRSTPPSGNPPGDGDS